MRAAGAAAAASAVVKRRRLARHLAVYTQVTAVCLSVTYCCCCCCQQVSKHCISLLLDTASRLTLETNLNSLRLLNTGRANITILCGKNFLTLEL